MVEEGPDEVAHVLASTLRMRRMRSLEQQANSSRAQLSLRRMVSERLSHPLLEQMRSGEFKNNPLADEEEEFDATTQRLAKDLTEVKRWMLSEGGVFDEEPSTSVNEIPRADQQRRARISLEDAATTTADESSEDGINDLVALKAVVLENMNHENGLDADEFVAALGQLWTSHSRQDLMQLFIQIDADSDGRVTWEELLTFLLQKEQAGDDNEINRFVRDLDKPPPAAGLAHSAPITQLVSLPDKDKYLSIGRDATLRMWQADTLAHTRTIAMPEKCWLNAAAYCEKHRRLAMCSAHSKLFIYDTNSMRVQRTWRLKTVGSALCVIEQPELSSAWASSLVLGDTDGMIYVYDWGQLLLGTLTVRYEVRLHDGWIEKLSLSKEAGGLLSCSIDGKLKLHALTVHGGLRERHCLASPAKRAICSFAYCAAHAAVATCGIERCIHWWSLSIEDPIATLYGHAAAVVSLACDEANHQLISLDVEGNVRVWDVRRLACVQILEAIEGEPVSLMMHDPLQQSLILAHTFPSSNPSIFVNHKSAKGARGEGASGGSSSPRPRDQTLLGAVASPALSLVLSVDEGSNVRSWHCADGSACFRFQLRDREAMAAPQGRGEQGSGGEQASAVAFDHSGRRLLVGRQDGKVRVYNFSSGQCLAECLPPPTRARAGGSHAKEISCVMGVREANLSWIVACGWSREVWVWPDQREGLGFRIECVQAMCGHVEDVTCLGYCAPNMLASGGHDATIFLWNFSSGTQRGLPLFHSPARPDGSAERSGGVDGGADGGRVRPPPPASVLDAKAFARSEVICVEQLAFINLEGETPSPLLVSAGGDSRLRFWSVVSTSLLFVMPLSPPPGVYSSLSVPITALHWSAQAAKLVVADSAGRVCMWDGARLKASLASAGGGAVAAAAAERLYRSLVPMLRWHAHDSAVASLSVICADWPALAKAIRSKEEKAGGASGAPQATSTATSDASGAPVSADVLEVALRQQTGTRQGKGDKAADADAPAPAPAVSASAAQAVEAGIFGPSSSASAVEGELLMTAARDGTLSLWTMGGIHIGTFTQGTWKVGEGASYGAPPQCWLDDPPRSWEHPQRGSPKHSRGPMLKSGASSSFLTSVEVEEEAEHQSVADDRPAVRASVASLLQHTSKRRAEREALTGGPNIHDNDEGGREAVLMQRATSGVHAALASAQGASAEGPLSFSMRPSSAALRQTASAPVLPHLRTIRAPPVDDETQRRRADERARATLTRKFREYQAQFDGALGGDATLSTDLYFRQREEAKAKPKVARPPLATHELGEVRRRRLANKGERLERLTIKF